MSASKKAWYGWKNDPKRSYYFDPYLDNFVYLFGRRGGSYPVSRLPRYVFNQNVKNGFNIILGRLNSGMNLSGHFDIWCDITSEKGPDGKEILEETNGYIYPKCNVSSM